MSAALSSLAMTVTAADLTAADMVGGFVALIVGIISFLAISGLAISMTVGASKSPGTMVVTGIAGLLSVIVAIGLYVSLTSTHAHLLADCSVKTWDGIGAILAIIVGTVSFLALGAIAVVMTIASFSPNKSPVTSWPMELEQTFAGYEHRNAASQSRAWVFSVIAGVVAFVFAIGVYKGVEPDMQDLSKDMNMSNITKKSSTAEPEAAKPEAAKPEAPEAPAPEAPAPEAETP